jgi:hypothetical protein
MAGIVHQARPGQEEVMFRQAAHVAVFAALALLAAGARAQSRGPGGEAWMKHLDKLGFARDYTVTMETEAEGSVFSSRMARLAPKTRMEMEMPQMGRMVTILDPEAANDRGGKGVTWMLFPASKTYMKMAAPAADAEGTSKAEVKVEELGKETMDGMVCEKRRLTVADPDTRRTQVTLFWTAAAVKNMPVRIETTEGGRAVVRFKDYDFAKPAADLFAVPADYTPGGFPGIMGEFTPPTTPAMPATPAMPTMPAPPAMPAVPAPPAAPTLPQAVTAATNAAVQPDPGQAAKEAAKEAARGAVNEGINRGLNRLFGR